MSDDNDFDEDDDGDDDDDDEDEDYEDEDEHGDEDEDDDEEKGREGERVKKAAAAMAVGVGSLSDPENCQGLAHYLEHMLFMGSEKYPEENAYATFIQQHGGSTNAYTEWEYTLYHFEIMQQHLEKALDIFAQFFVSPLMLADSSDRELQSIESEFRLNLNNDACRMEALWCHTSKPGHPFSKFSWGNMASLKDEPEAKGVNVRAALAGFHRLHYTAKAMQLVVLGTDPLDKLQEMVARSFTGVVAGSICGGPGGIKVGGGAVTGNGEEVFLPLPSTVTSAGMPMGEDCMGTLFRVQPVKDIHCLHVTWQVPEQESLYRTKPYDYLGHLIGHEGKGTIFSLLRQKRWVTEIEAGVSNTGFTSGSSCAMFCVTFDLTQTGVRHWLDIVTALFEYVGMLRREGPQEWIFEEIRDVADLLFRFHEEKEPEETVEELAERMSPPKQYDDSHILKGPSLFDVWDPDLIQARSGCMKQTFCLLAFTPETARYDLQSSLYGRSIDAAGTQDVQGGGGGSRLEGGMVLDYKGMDVDVCEEDDDESEEDDYDDCEEEEEEQGEDDDEEEEEEGVEEGVKVWHPLCCKPEKSRAPLREPRFGILFWRDPVPEKVTYRAFALSVAGVHGGPVPLALFLLSSLGGGQMDLVLTAQAGGNDSPFALPQPNLFIPTKFKMHDLPPGAAPTEPLSKEHTMRWEKERREDRENGGVHMVPALETSKEGSLGNGLGTDRAVREEVGLPPSPRLVRESSPDDSSRVVLWHLQDHVFRLPKAEIFLKVVTPTSNANPRLAALSDLLIYLVNESLTEYSYAAYVADLHFTLKTVDTGFQVHVNGFDHKAPLLLKKVLSRLLSFGPHLAKGERSGPLLMQLEALLRSYANSGMKPGKQAFNARVQALRPGQWSAKQKQEAIMARPGSSGPSVELVDMEEFLVTVFSSLELECFVHGNFREEDAVAICEDMEKVARERGGGRGNGGQFLYPEQRVVKLNPLEHVVYCCPSKDATEENCALEMYWQLGPDNLQDRLLADAIEQLMDEPLFDQLRTKEQLGYSLNCGVKVTAGVLGFCITVHSSAFGPAHVYERVQAFVTSFMDTLMSMKQEIFSTQMSSLVANKLQEDNNIMEEAERHWTQIRSRRHWFHVNILEARGLAGVTHKAVVDAYREWFVPMKNMRPGKPHLTIMVAGVRKYSVEEEWEALELMEETAAKGKAKAGATGVAGREGDRTGGVHPGHPKLVRIGKPEDLYGGGSAGERGLFPNFVG
ncbi:unnamed protein product [Discosporangium mesarthrocarpum]